MSKGIKRTFRTVGKVAAVGAATFFGGPKAGIAAASAIQGAKTPPRIPSAIDQVGQDVEGAQDQVAAEAKRLRRRRGFRAGILTSPRGILSSEEGLTRRPSLLGA